MAFLIAPAPLASDGPDDGVALFDAYCNLQATSAGLPGVLAAPANEVLEVKQSLVRTAVAVG